MMQVCQWEGHAHAIPRDMTCSKLIYIPEQTASRPYVKFTWRRPSSRFEHTEFHENSD